MHPLFTYGYSGGMLTDLQAYAAAGAVIVDVRYRPWSRVPQWRGESLRAALGGAYVHFGSLGNVHYRGDGPIRLANWPVGRMSLEKVLSERPAVLLCACADAGSCHRSVVVEKMVEAFPGLVVRHLLPGDTLAGPAADTLRVLTLYQPWASLIALGAKTIETRPWSTSYRGPLAIHAGKTTEYFDLCFDEPCRSTLVAGGITNTGDLPLGAIVAVCDLVDVRSTNGEKPGTRADWLNDLSECNAAFGGFDTDRFGWFLENIRPVNPPVPAVGKHGLWSMDRALLEGADRSAVPQKELCLT
jgi:activating signal cointegrator 1